ncbi:PRE1 [Ecytonucleospora hepatopenaei]|uniref:PRE1 n=1 Tax=Ecytonucleospora hepatopenaei TaxID=646526 RepID=A0A1W0E333_9MICR|nr:PRE1 [Ecytonucleospora hepatopenaei]
MISFAFVTKDKGYLISQTTINQDIMRIKESKNEVDNINNILVNVSGKNSDIRYVRSLLNCKNDQYRVFYGNEVNISMLSNIARSRIYNELRKEPVKDINILMLSVNNNNSNTVYNDNSNTVYNDNSNINNNFNLIHIDNYSAINKSNFIATNYGMYFLYGIADTYYTYDMNHDQAVDLINRCIKALKEKMVLDASKWRMDVLDKNNEQEIQYIE